MIINDTILEFLTDWEKKLNNNEWHFEEMREKIINNLDQEKAFESIMQIIEILLKQKNEYLFSELFDLLLSVIKKSNTTETPSSFKDIFDKLKNISISFNDNYINNQFEELKLWYRL